MLFDHWVYFLACCLVWPIVPQFFMGILCCTRPYIEKIVKVLSNWYQTFPAIWKLILWAPFSATLHYYNRILANARKSPKIDLMCPGTTLPCWPNLIRVSWFVALEFQNTILWNLEGWKKWCFLSLPFVDFSWNNSPVSGYTFQKSKSYLSSECKSKQNPGISEIL